MQARATNRDRRRFGLFEVRSGELFKRGIQVRLQDQPLQILVTLLERPGDIVSREELKQVLWPNGTVVDFDEGLNTAVKKLRSALGDAPENPTFIETVPRRGYRFLAPVTREPSEILERNVAEIVPAPCLNGNGPGLSARRPYWLFLLLAGVAVLALALTIFGWWRLRASGPSDITERQLTNDSRENPIFQAAISGDGKYLAFAESSGLHLRLLQTDEVRDLPQPQEFKDVDVSWSIVWFPDSTRFLAVAYSAGKPASTWQASVLGGVLREVRGDAVAWSVSPDGSSIALTNGGRPYGSEILSMGADGQNPRKLFEAPRQIVFSHVQWSPDGRRLLYLKHRQIPGHVGIDIESRDLTGGPPATVFSDPKLRELHWLPDGRLLYVLSEPDLNRSTCTHWIAKTDKATGALRGQPKELKIGSGFCMGAISATSNGRRSTFTKRTVEISVVVAAISADGNRISPPRRLTYIDAQEWPIGWTVDSRSVIFASNRGHAWGFYKQRLDSDDAEPVLQGIVSRGLGALFGAVSPDGAWLLYTPYPGDHVPGEPIEVLRVPMTGGKPALVLKAPLSDVLRCAQLPARLCAVGTAEGNQLVFTSFDPVNGIGRELARVDIDPNFSYTWNLSSDGSRIGIVKRGTGEIRIVSLKTRKERKFYAKQWDHLFGMDWTSDGTGLLVAAARPKSALLHLDLDGNGHVIWEPGGNSPTYALASPDGSHLALLSYAIRSNVWMMENF